MAKTFYPGLRRGVEVLVRYLSKHQTAMVQQLGIAGTSYQTDLAALVAALNQININWPAYKEEP